MKEDLLQFIWRQKLVPLKNLKTTEGEDIRILYAGKYNTDGGPDFLEAKIRVGETILAGSVEIHVRASDWTAHCHNDDRKYSNVILHVVYFNDENSPLLPTLELNGKIPPLLLQRYKLLMDSGSVLPCESYWKEVDEMTVESMWERMIVERLERKSGMILQLLQKKNNDWLQVIYLLLGKYFGGTVNQFGFETLLEKLEYKILLKHADDIFQLEALLFGVAGLLNEPLDEHQHRLQKEFEYLQSKYQLPALPGHYWNFLRIRPASFPTVRLALFAQLVHHSPQFTHLANYKNAKRILEKLQASGYWNDHYIFGKPVEPRLKHLGHSAINSLLINVCIPLQYAYAKNLQQADQMTEAIELLNSLPAEENKKIKLYEGLSCVKTAYDSQALIELHDQYCTARKCLHCRIGNKILQGNVRLQHKCCEPDPEYL